MKGTTNKKNGDCDSYQVSNHVYIQVYKYVCISKDDRRVSEWLDPSFREGGSVDSTGFRKEPSQVSYRAAANQLQALRTMVEGPLITNPYLTNNTIDTY